MEFIIVENVNTGHWFIAHVHDSYGLSHNWIPSSQSIENKEKYKETIIQHLLYGDNLDKLIPTPNLPDEEEQRLLHIFYKVHKDREEFKYDPKRMKVELIYRDHYITGKSLYDAKKTVEDFLRNIEGKEK